MIHSYRHLSNCQLLFELPTWQSHKHYTIKQQQRFLFPLNMSVWGFLQDKIRAKQDFTSYQRHTIITHSTSRYKIIKREPKNKRQINTQINNIVLIYLYLCESFYLVNNSIIYNYLYISLFDYFSLLIDMYHSKSKLKFIKIMGSKRTNVFS